MLVMAGLCLVASACRIEHKVEPIAGATTSLAGSFENKNFNPQSLVESMWDSKVIPALSSRAADFTQLRSAMRANLDTAGASNGHRERGEGAPWNFATTVKGKIVSVDTESSAGKIGVDTDGDGQADVLVQIGPVLRGTALRDSLPFMRFTDYTNQIEFAQLANALNDHAYAGVLKTLPRDQLIGRNLVLLGSFTTDDASEIPTIMPAQLKLEAKP